MNRLIIGRMPVYEKSCTVLALQEEGRIMEIQVMADGDASMTGNIYAAQVERIAANIQAAFLLVAPGVRAYLPLAGSERAVFLSGRTWDGKLRPGDLLLVQIQRESLKSKLPTATVKLTVPGRCMVVMNEDRKDSFSHKLSPEDRERLRGWLEEKKNAAEPGNNITADTAAAGRNDTVCRSYPVIIRTNAGEASREEFNEEYLELQRTMDGIVRAASSRTAFSCLYETPPFYMEAVRDLYSRGFDDYVTDDPEIYEQIRGWVSVHAPSEISKLRLYEDHQLPLYKLYSLEGVLDEAHRKKIWLKSGGFLVIEETEALVAVDVNTGKCIDKKKDGEIFRRVNREAADEIARQIRLRNLSGMILIDFINMDRAEDEEELLTYMRELCAKDRVQTRAVDFTKLHILEMTRKKVRRSLAEDLQMLYGQNHQNTD